MKVIDINSWKRKEHFNFFKDLSYPHFNVCININITNFYNYIKENDLPFFASFLYIVSKVANETEEFKYRIRDDKVIIHDVIHPSFTVLTVDELFSFGITNYNEDFQTFKESTLSTIKETKNKVCLDDENRDDLIYISSLPWISFSSVTHPIQINAKDSVPRITWGKYYKELDNIKLPLSVQVHHGLADGFHVSRYINDLEKALSNPKEFL